VRPRDCDQPAARATSTEGGGFAAAHLPARRACYGAAPPASTVLRIPLRGTRLRRAVDPGDLCQPSGPDGEGQARGQARNARGRSGGFDDLLATTGSWNVTRNEDGTLPAGTLRSWSWIRL